ncbi:MAG TPA: acylphosphatase [Pyrinomonadaceae bacterium]|nr:acylphosphatase [Chloracidobacterium sp.]MBP9936260.1 acylphosphatase [Pyrinomonadaceae bacterium]MBK9767795.1 acylphosphatase [Chloracidobacterium sp.]MBL0239768.1 acylphosphatase [Chloracidobacterium sp.]HQX56542.1 acylphosphatase [Pyrinomonadaceae bacterium]
MTIARRFFISGEVQGVGYRFFAQRSAARYQVRGYIRNLADGRVEALVEGSEKAVNSFRADLAAGPINARVGPIEELVLDPCGLYSAFRIEK